jgi:hypothetical protein
VLWISFSVLIELQPLTPRGFDEFDPGFQAYTGFLLMEAYYSNPVLVCCGDA